MGDNGEMNCILCGELVEAKQGGRKYCVDCQHEVRKAYRRESYRRLGICERYRLRHHNYHLRKKLENEKTKP
jgi:hypothetical protein